MDRLQRIMAQALGYTNGVSAHAADNWIIRGNVFKDFHTPDNSDYPWNPAVLMWNHSTNTLTERNTFINVDRAISYGLHDISGSDHSGGTIRNNFVYLEPGLMSAGEKQVRMEHSLFGIHQIQKYFTIHFC